MATPTVFARPTGWNSVHLPIIYTLSNIKFPSNTEDTPRAVSSPTNDGGYTKITLAGDIKTNGSTNELEFVTLSVNSVTSVYQILTYYSETEITIDLPYDGSNTFGNCLYYYSNYHQKVRIYAGLRLGHTLNTTKPYTLLAEIKAVPGSDNKTKINISEILKSKMDILGTGANYTQNDLDSFCEFYISFAESYDYSADGYTLATYTSSYDTTESSNYAMAVNSKLPFRSNGANGGKMVSYVGASRKFLTLFDNPVIFPSNTYEIWFIRDVSDSYDLRARRYVNGVLNSTSTITLDAEDEGIYHVPISVTGNEDEILVDLYSGSSQSEVKTIKVNQDCYDNYIYLKWKNYLGGMDYWLFTAEKEYGIEVEDVKTTEKNIFIDFPNSWNGDTITYETQRKTRESILVRSQNLTLSQLNAIKYIKTSPVVKIDGDRKVLVDANSFTVYTETDKLYSISFNIQYTNDIASQSL